MNKKRLYTVKEVMAITGFSSRKVQRRCTILRVKKWGTNFRITEAQMLTIRDGWYLGRKA